MSTLTATHPHVAALLTGCDPARGGLAWLNARRSRALERANALAVPTTRDEEWRFTDIAPLTRLHFRPAAAAGAPAPDALAGSFSPEAAARLVFVDGAWSAALSATAGLPRGVVAAPLAAALAAHGAAIEPHLARLADDERDIFAAVNTGQLRDGAFLWIAQDVQCAAPVELLFVSTQPETATYPRCLVVAEPGAGCLLIERHVALTGAPYFSNGVTEIVARAGARVRHVRVQDEGHAAFHVATCAVALERDAGYESHAVTLGARISRHNLHLLQRGEGAQALLRGLTLIGGRQLADTHTLIDHARGNGRSRQLHKCIVGGAGHAVFSGKIVVRPGAQLTDSAQESRNLLLSGKAHVDTKPQLEIFADDVKCAHGATVGQLDPEQLFYLRSRGLADEPARNLLTYAFGAEVIDRIPVPSLVGQLERVVLAQTGSAA
jgi:Fe-S cluster assembly protein SufD